jgi:hypothetical protein
MNHIKIPARNITLKRLSTEPLVLDLEQGHKKGVTIGIVDCILQDGICFQNGLIIEQEKIK